MEQATLEVRKPRSRATAGAAKLPLALICGAVIGILGGLIGLGGAEFRLPLLIALFGFVALPAVILNRATSVVVVVSALLFRTKAVPVQEVVAHWPIVVNLLVGCVAGAWSGADWATRLKSRALYRVLSVLLFFIGIVLMLGHHGHASHPLLSGWAQLVAGVIVGFGIGVVAVLMGVAGNELLIPTLILLFGVNIKLAGSLSLAVSLPTMIVGFARYRKDNSFAVLRQNWIFLVMMAAGSLIGAAIGAQLLGIVPTAVLLPILSAILFISAVKVWQHG
jgi:uncharacterized membrane protein YfcA